jgi:Fibronectin type III domain
MVRRLGCSAVVLTLISLGALGLAPAAGAASTTQLLLSQEAAFSILGHSCGGIQEHAYATGFGPGGYPAGDVYMQTRCGGSGRGGGYTETTYSAWATVTWDWYGGTRSYARLEGAAVVSTTFSAEDAYGDRVYNTETAAYLETTSPPIVAPEAPTGVTASPSNIEVGEQFVLRFQVSWTPAATTAALITSSTVTATPVGSTAPVLTTTVSGRGSSAIVSPLQPNTTYRITVTSSDSEGTSAPSQPIEVTSPNEDGVTVGKEPVEEGPEFGRCVKVAGAGRFTTGNCETESATETGGYEWVRSVTKPGFATTIKPLTTVRLEATNKEKVTCTGERSTGQITGPKTAGNVVITLTGCESLGGSCTAAGLGNGELQTATLEGTLGIVSTTEKEGKEILHIGLSLHAPDEAPLLEYACSTSGIAVIRGAVIAPVTSGKMLKATPFKLAATAGKQKPESFETGVREVLTNQLNEQVGLTLSATQTNEQAVEINPLF